MNFRLRIFEEMEENYVEVICNKRNYETIRELLKKVQHLDGHLPMYDDEHNMFQIHLMQVYYFESIDNKVFAYTAQDMYRIYQSFSQLKKALSEQGIKQINKNTLVNINHVQSVKVAKDCRRILCLDNQEQLIVNRQFRNFMES